MYHLLERPSQRTLFSDASNTAVGGFCLETGVYWRYDLDAGKRSRFCGSSKSVAGENDVSIDVLELLGMVVSAWVLASRCAERPAALGDYVCCVLLRGDNETAVEWVRRCRGGKESRSGALMRLLDVLELFCGWHFDPAKHVRGIFTLTLTVSHAGIAFPSSFICVRFVRKFRGRSRIWSLCLLPRASEMLAETRLRVHETYFRGVLMLPFSPEIFSYCCAVVNRGSC